MTSKVTRWRKFDKEQNGILPCNLAAAYLGVSRQQIYKWRKSGRLATIGTGGVTYYGMKSLSNMKWEQSAKLRHRRELAKIWREKQVDLDSEQV